MHVVAVARHYSPEEFVVHSSKRGYARSGADASSDERSQLALRHRPRLHKAASAFDRAIDRTKAKIVRIVFAPIDLPLYLYGCIPQSVAASLPYISNGGLE
jgi:hypothetical protein